MVTLTGLADVQAWLRTHGGLGEALLTRLCLDEFGYSVRLELEQVIDPLTGRLLPERPTVVVHLRGVSSMRVDGGLTDTMLREPDEMGWGLSEVAGVEVESCGDDLRFRVCWESERMIEIVSRSMTWVVEP